MKRSEAKKDSSEMSCTYARKGQFKVIIGRPRLEFEVLFGLVPGTRITRIGRPARDGKSAGESSSSRFDDFAPYIIFAGVHYRFHGQADIPAEELACFLVPEGGATLGGEKIDEAVYLAYDIIRESRELVLPIFRSRAGGSIRIYKSSFTVYRPADLKKD